MTTHDPVGDLGFQPGVLLIGTTLVGLSLASAVWGGASDWVVLERMGAWTPELAWSEPWRLVTNTWLHAGPVHLISNMFGLLLFGVPLERTIGWRRLWLLYVTAALVGAACGVFIGRPDGLVGASGAVFGVVGAAAGLAWRPRDMLHPGEIAVLREAVWPLGFAMMLSSLQPGISVFSHLGGLAVGLLLGATGLLTAGLEARAPESGHSDVHIGRAVLSTVLVGVLAVCFQPVLLALYIAYAVIVGLVAWSEPRYVAREGWAVTGASLLAAAAYWATLGLSLGTGQPWAPSERSLQWVALGDGLPEVRAASPDTAELPDGLLVGTGRDRLQITATWEPHDAPVDQAWIEVARLHHGVRELTLHDAGGCPHLTADDLQWVVTDDRIVRVSADGPSGSRRPEVRGPEHCAALTLDQRVAARDAAGLEHDALRLLAEADPTDPVAEARLLRAELACPERIGELERQVGAHPELALVAGWAAADCSADAADGWLAAAPEDDGLTWAVRAERAWRRGRRAQALVAAERAVDLLSDEARDAAQRRMMAMRDSVAGMALDPEPDLRP